MTVGHKVYIALGSNIGNRVEILADAVATLADKVGEVTKRSHLIETAPFGFVSNHAFLNQVVEIITSLSPLDLLNITIDIEKKLGRKQKSHDGIYHDRTCDIDIILYDDLIFHSTDLDIPHPRFRERDFVLVPLCEIAPDVIDPVTRKTIFELRWGE